MTVVMRLDRWRWFIGAIATVVLVALVISYLFHFNAETQARAELQAKHASASAQLGIISEVTQHKLFDLKDRVKGSGVLSDDDLQFCISEFRKGPLVDSQDNWASLAIETSTPLCYANSYTEEEYKKIEEFANTMIDKGYDGCQKSAVIMLQRVHAPHRAEVFDRLIANGSDEVKSVAQRMKDKDAGNTS